MGLVVVYGVWISDGKLFLLHRDISYLKIHYKDVWEPPGGAVDKGETPDSAVLREWKEETGLEATIKSFLGSVIFRHGKPKVNALFYLIESEMGRIDLGDPEHLGWKFFSPEELRNLSNPALSTVAAVKLLRAWGLKEFKTQRSDKWDDELFLPR
ncbi:MAG: NUDIX hydrolase [Candidatus Diapherotrites archaeon]|nr:NUDIX hydrolase [Candidatus Diapherotrites archaeon]